MGSRMTINGDLELEMEQIQSPAQRRALEAAVITPAGRARNFVYLSVTSCDSLCFISLIFPW